MYPNIVSHGVPRPDNTSNTMIKGTVQHHKGLGVDLTQTIRVSHYIIRRPDNEYKLEAND